MLRTAVVGVLSLSVLPAGDAIAQATIGGDWRADVAAFAARVVDAGLTPGIGISVAVGDWVAWADGFGLADASTGRHVTGDTPFYIASSTKSLTATAAAIAAVNGELAFSAPMTRYLPDAHLPDGMPRDRITVHDLAALTHGLAGDGPVVWRTAFTGDFTRDQLLDLLRYHAPTGNYGTFNYNNLGYNLLGMVLESIYQESWKEVVQRLVLDPAGMTSTSAYLSRIAPDRIARPHDVTGAGWAVAPLAKADANLHAAGGHFASARDLARYLAAHISGGMVEGRRAFPEEAVALTHRQQVAQDRDFGPYHRFGWAYGWDLGTYDGDTLIHRFGGFSGYRSHMSFMPRHGVGVVVLVNGDGPASSAADLVATYAYDRLLGKPNVEARFGARLDSLAARARDVRQSVTAQLAGRRARLAPLRHPLEDFAGVYESPVLGRMEWRVVAGGLEATMGVMRARAEVFDAARDRLRVEVAGSGNVVTFLFPRSGPAETLRLGDQEFARVRQ